MRPARYLSNIQLSNSRKGIVKKCKITVPKQMTAKQLRKLKKAVKKAGAGSKVTYKKK